jgi:hypothetical protein
MQATVQVTKRANCNHVILDISYEDESSERLVFTMPELNPQITRASHPVLSAIRHFIKKNNLQSATNAQIKAAIEAETFEI